MELPQVKGRIEYNYPLKRLNTWKIGGPGKVVFWPENANELVMMYKWCKNTETPVIFLGRGSNVLLPDRGFMGMIIVSTRLNRKSWQEDRVICEAGVSLTALAREATEKGLKGLEFACGIPGTVGAAIAINAGAHGGEIGKLVDWVRVMTSEGERLTLDKENLCFEYRRSTLSENNYFVLEGALKLEFSQDISKIKEIMAANLARRRSTQPLEYPNAGSVFRNPSGDSAGRLIEAAGWKGKKIGDAQVSEKHTNFIVNRGNARAEDVLRLIREIQEDVYQKFGVELKPEIRVITG